MVDGCLNKLSATIVDLDGTYINGNTLKMYLTIGVKDLLRHGRLDKATAIVVLVAVRKLRLIDHESMKYRAIRLIAPTTRVIKQMCDCVKKHINDNVATFLDRRCQAGDIILMATAAPEFYVKWFWDGNLIASPSDGPDCKGDIKRDAVSNWLAAKNAKPANFLTDHHDDLPLAQISETVILVNPSEKTIEAFKSTCPEAKCRVLTKPCR